MIRMQKITVTVLAKHLEGAQAVTGACISEMVRIALRYLVLENERPSLSTDERLARAREPLRYG